MEQEWVEGYYEKFSIPGKNYTEVYINSEDVERLDSYTGCDNIGVTEFLLPAGWKCTADFDEVWERWGELYLINETTGEIAKKIIKEKGGRVFLCRNNGEEIPCVSRVPKWYKKEENE